jgi:dihydropyrimidine dehydrogenase (NAD+) subunit PreA
LRCVAQIRQNSNLPILGMGGVSDWHDAAEYMCVGADVVQVCTEVMINGYAVIKAMKHGLLNYLESKGFNSPADLKNRAIDKLSAHEKLNKQKQVYPYIDDALCIKCGKCATICDESEHSALALVDGHIVVNQDVCVGCSLCSHVCPKSAIKMK